MNSVSNIENEYKSEITKLEKDSEKYKIIGGCLIAIAIIITGIAIALCFILPVWVFGLVVTMSLMAFCPTIVNGVVSIVKAERKDNEIAALKQQNKESITLEAEYPKIQTRITKKDCSGVDLEKVDPKK